MKHKKAVTLQNILKLCRSCLQNEANIDVFETHSMNLSLSQVIQICTGVMVYETDGMSRVICNSCVEQLTNSHKFVIMFKESQINLKNILYEAKESEKPVSVCAVINSGGHQEKSSENNELKGQDSHVINREDHAEEEVSHLLTVTENNTENYNQSHQSPSSTFERLSEPSDDEEETKKEKRRKPNKRIEVDPNFRSDLDLQCFQCLEVFSSKVEIINHHKITSHTMAPNYKCGICSKAISKRKAYWDHMAMHRHLKKKAVCEVCGAVVISLHLKRHMLVHQERSYFCQYCGKGYVQKNTLTEHVRRKHEGDEKDMNTLCFICGQMCSDLKCLTIHLNTHTDEKLKGLPHQCKDCGKYFLNEQSLNTHVYMAHKITDRIPKQHKRMQSIKRKSKRPQKDKKESISKGENYDKRKGSLKREPKECPTCHKMICHLGYSRHLTTHTGVKPHKCNYCPKSFRLFTSLKSHTYVHLNIKPFKCDACEKEFRHYTTLKVHKRVHTGEKPYTCPACSKGFRSASGLKRHQNQRKHHLNQYEMGNQEAISESGQSKTEKLAVISVNDND